MRAAMQSEALFSLAPNVEDIAVGQIVSGEYGQAEVLDVEISKWRFSEKPKCRLTFRDIESGETYARSYFPWWPIENNHANIVEFSSKPTEAQS